MPELTNKSAADTPAADGQAPSLPLYVAAGVVMLCGIFAANAAITQPDYVWMGRTLAVSGAGLLLSYAARARAARRPGGGSRAADVGVGLLLLLALAGVASGAVSVDQFLPAGADKGELRLLAELVWGGAVWTWLLRTDVRVLELSIPVMASLGLAAEVDLNPPVLVCFGVFILTVIFLLIHQNYLQNRVRAETSGPGPDGPRRLLLAQLAQTGLCGAAVLLAGSLVIVPAQAVFSHLSIAQAIRQLAAGRAAPAPSGPVLRFSDGDTLPLGTGEAWSASADVVMRVTPSDGREHYWRGRTYDDYTGDQWKSSLEGDRTEARPAAPDADSDFVRCDVRPALTPGDPDPSPAGGADFSARFTVRGETDQFYGAARPRQVLLNAAVTAGGRLPQVCADGRLDMGGRRTISFPYVVVSQPPPDPADPSVRDRLRRAGTDYPDAVRRLYLRVGGNGLTQDADIAFYRQAVAEALAGLPPDAAPLDKALALREWVSRRCVYSLAVPPIAQGDDHVRAFLNDTRRGYCDMFASSLAVLCRTAGIPARLATGFAPGEPDGDGFNLRAEDKHAWTEVYFPQAGWVALDATAGSVSDGSVPGASGRSAGGLAAWLARLRGGLGAGWELVAPLLAIVFAIVIYVLKTEFFDRRRASVRAARPARLSAPRTDLGRQYARMGRALARTGLPRLPPETPTEYAARAQTHLREVERRTGIWLPAALAPALTLAFTRAAYGDPSAAPARADAFDAPLRELESGAWRVWWKTLGRKKAKPAALPEGLVS